MEVDANNLYNWAMSQEMPDGDFEWLSQDECRDMGLLLSYADGRIAIFDIGLFDHPENDEDTASFILEVDVEYLLELFERDDDYPLAPDVMTIEPEIINEKQHNLRAQYFGAVCPYSRKLIYSFHPNKHYVVLRQLLRFYLDRGMMLLKLHRAILFKSPPYVASYIANNIVKR